MMERGASRHMMTEGLNQVANRTFGQEETEFNIAAGFVRRDSYMPEHVDPTGFVEIAFELRSWNFRSGEIDTQTKRLSSSLCTEENVQANFYRAPETNSNYVNQVIASKSMYCMDDLSEIALRGHNNHDDSQILFVTVYRCSGIDCATDSEIDDFIDQHKLYVMYNQ